MVVSSARWLGVRLDTMCAFFITAVAVGALLVLESPGERSRIVFFENRSGNTLVSFLVSFHVM